MKRFLAAWLLALAVALGLCHPGGRWLTDQPHTPTLYAGALIAVLAGVTASLVKVHGIGKPARSFLLFAAVPGVLRLIVFCAIIAGVLVRTEGVAIQLAVGMLCGSLTSLVAEVTLLAAMDGSARTATPPGRE